MERVRPTVQIRILQKTVIDDDDDERFLTCLRSLIMTSPFMTINGENIDESEKRFDTGDHANPSILPQTFSLSSDAKATSQFCSERSNHAVAPSILRCCRKCYSTAKYEFTVTK